MIANSAEISANRANPDLSHIKGMLLDLNGVFYVGNRLLPGAVETLEAVRNSGMPFRFATNNTTESTGTLCQHLNDLGLPVKAEEIISAPYAAVLHLRKRPDLKCYLLLTREVKQEFAEFTTSETDANVVVMGDMDNEWNYPDLNRAFRLLMRGAELVALHKAKFWQWEGGLHLDIGAFVTGLEYATDTHASVVGKPSAMFYNLALEELGLPAEQVVMIGDDIENDVGGAQALGLTGILVKTGKYRPHVVAQSPVVPDAVVDAVGAIPQLFA